VNKAISGLSQVFLASAKNNLNVNDFHLSVAECQLSTEAVAVLAHAYGGSLEALRAGLLGRDSQPPRYHRLDWRLDLQVATAGCCLLSAAL
jgi:hypothetical protein